MCSGERTQVIEVEVLRMGPFDAQGLYALSATLYNSNQPVPNTDGTPVTGMSAWRQHKGAGDVHLRSGMLLEGVHVVFEVLQQKLSLLGTFLHRSVNHLMLQAYMHCQPRYTIACSLCKTQAGHSSPECQHGGSTRAQAMCTYGPARF
jgi:hypothetical protein